MKKARTAVNGFQRILERKDVELGQLLRKRDGIAIETSADHMDEIQYASERDLAIRNVDQRVQPAASGKSRAATDSRRQLRDLH